MFENNGMECFLICSHRRMIESLDIFVHKSLGFYVELFPPPLDLLAAIKATFSLAFDGTRTKSAFTLRYTDFPGSLKSRIVSSIIVGFPFPKLAKVSTSLRLP